MYYLDVILPLPLAGSFTYSNSSAIEVGCRVIVQFGKKKFYSAIVINCYEAIEEKSGIKEISTVLDETPMVLESQLELWKWMSEYYMCHLGEVYKAALPSALKLESETRVNIVPDNFPDVSLTPTETKVYDLLSDEKVYSISEITKKTGLSNAILAIRSLFDKGLVSTDEHISQKFKPKTETIVRLALDSDSELHAALNQLSRAPKQLKLLSTFLEQIHETKYSDYTIPSEHLLELSDLNGSILKSLIDKKIFKTEKREINSEIENSTEIETTFSLNSYQKKALEQIKESFNSKNITLLHGVTSSGKTEIYIKLISEQLALGKQVLYLLPEIALTTQITRRLKAVFGEKIGIYHSKFTDNERAEVWNNLIKNNGYQVILGVRSSVFLPFCNLGLIIVDEEHEASYKQQDPAPRYHGRNTAIWLASIHKAKTLLGTATPAIETYFNALNGKYGLVELTHRHENIELPRIEVINTKELRRKKIMKSQVFSPILLEKMENAFKLDEQVILFRNRRGFAPYVECKTCGYTPKCCNCDVSLTYHKRLHILSCHYCGANYPVNNHCPACDTDGSMQIVGFGTERIEEEISEFFPSQQIARMDLDTTRSRKAYEKILDSFSSGETKILIGTQMVSKGLDFNNVNLVGIIQADSLLNQPDFRAHERAFQMLEQVSGRAGRRSKQGLVVLQTTNPDSRVIKSVCKHDYIQFYNDEIKERELFKYPPFYRILHVIMRGKDSALLQEASIYFANLVRRSFGDRVLGPIEPPISRVQSLFIRQIMIKTENNSSPSGIRETISNYLKHFYKQSNYKSILIHIDIDPM